MLRRNREKTGRLCLNLLLNGTSENLERTLRSVVHVIDYYVICDTGATGDSVELATSFLRRHKVQGKVIRVPFTDFSQVRNEALRAAQLSERDFEYILFIDADMELEVLDPAWRSQLTADAYVASHRTLGGLEYPNIRLVRKTLPCEYVGATHEYLDLRGARAKMSTSFRFVDHAAGSNRTEKFQRDLGLLQDAIKSDPTNARNVFYLANTHFDMGNLRAAIDWYQVRSTMGGYLEEVFYAKYRIGRAYLGLDDERNFIGQMLDTFDEFPHRAETVHSVAQHALGKKKYRLALMFAEAGLKVPKPRSALFVESDVYDWRLTDIASVALYWLKRPAEALELAQSIVEKVPATQKPRILENIKYCEVALGRAPA